MSACVAGAGCTETLPETWSPAVPNLPSRSESVTSLRSLTRSGRAAFLRNELGLPRHTQPCQPVRTVIQRPARRRPVFRAALQFMDAQPHQDQSVSSRNFLTLYRSNCYLPVRLLRNRPFGMLFSANIGFMTVTSIMELPVWTQFYEKQSEHPISNVFILS